MYLLTVPGEYTLFSGDLNVQYEIPRDVSLASSFVRVVLLTDTGEEEITNLGFDSNYKTGTLTVTCGILEVAGKYQFQMYMTSGGRLLVQASILVRWPKMVLTLPNTHVAESSSVHLWIHSPAKCNPRLRRFSFHVELEYAENRASLSSNKDIELLSSQTFSQFSTENSSVALPCSLFDLSGIYRATLKSSVSAISIVSRSNEMLTNLNPAYSIHIGANDGTIFPCRGTLMINYYLPACHGAKENNKIRIYMLRRTEAGSIASPLERSYVVERTVDPTSTYLTEPCDLFKTVATSYCFQFVTLTRKGLINQTELCLPAHHNSGMCTNTVESRYGELIYLSLI